MVIEMTDMQPQAGSLRRLTNVVKSEAEIPVRI
jgi:hypothetical protein